MGGGILGNCGREWVATFEEFVAAPTPTTAPAVRASPQRHRAAGRPREWQTTARSLRGRSPRRTGQEVWRGACHAVELHNLEAGGMRGIRNGKLPASHARVC